MRERIPRGIIVSTTLLLVLAMQAFAFAITWVGGVSDDWNTPANWSPAGPPNAPGFPPNDGAVGIGGGKTNYWPVIYNNHYNGSAVVPGPDASGFNASGNLLSLPEGATYAQLTFEGGIMYMSADQYMMIGRHNTDTADFTVNSGGIGQMITGTLWGPTRWLRIGRGDSLEGGLGTMVQNGGVIYAQAMSVGNILEGSTAVAGSSATINGGELYIGGQNYFDASFDIAANASMTINPGALVKLDATQLQDGTRVTALGALNIVADGSGSGRLIIPWYIDSVAGLRAWFGDGTTQGNVNAIYDGGPGQFVFSYPGGLFTEITVIPEPATLALLAAGAFMVSRKKRS